MARQIKATNYFSHDSNARNDAKLINVRMKHGAAGYGVYFMILERMREEANHMSARDYNMIAYDLRVDAALVKAVVEDFGLFVFAEGGKYFYSESFNTRMQAMDAATARRRAAGKKAMESRWGIKHDSDTDTTKPLPANQTGTNGDVGDDAFYRRFFDSNNAANIEALLKNFGLNANQRSLLMTLTSEVIAEWKISDKQHNNYTDWSQHLIATMRIKYNERKKQKVNTDVVPPATTDYAYNGGFGSKDV